MASAQTSHPFTCNTCQVAFRSSELQRTHMQSDWHRYNLKRRVASLPPLTSEIFAEKVLANKATAAATAARASFEKRCDACDKSFFSEGAYGNHLKSQKHKILAARLSGKRSEGNETDSMADSTFTLGETLETASTRTGHDSEIEEMLDGVVTSMKSADLKDTEESSHPVRQPATIAAQHDEHADEEYEHKANLDQCLFCNYNSPNLELNIHHMSRQHSFFVPEREYLVDLQGLLHYLSETIQVLHQCLYCHKAVHTTSGIQTHMRDRGHCMLAYNTEDEQMEVGEFYDFTSTYSDEDTAGEEEDVVDGGVSLGVKRSVKTTVARENGEEMEVDDDEDEGWESDSTLSSVPTDEITAVPVDTTEQKYAKLGLHRHHSHVDARPHKNSDGYHSHAHHTPQAVYHDDFELHLPSGRTAGHRSMKVYYRQNLRNYPTPEERSQQRMVHNRRHDSDADDSDAETASQSTETNSTARGRQLISRADGGLGMLGVNDAKKREVRAVEKREQKRQQRAQNRYQAGNERRNNFQKHFRDPLLQ